MESLIGKLVYTVNNTKKQVDVWRCIDSFKGPNNEVVCELKDGGKVMILPKRCVYSTFKAAQRVLHK